MADIKKAAVIGAGVMGAGIAAHITNAGIPCVLLDIVPKTGDNRNAIAEGAVSISPLNDEFGIDSEMGGWLKGEIDAHPAAVPAMSR